MKTFGDTNIEWRDVNGITHVLVATKGSAWLDLCIARPSEYETVEFTPHPSDEAIVWKHDRDKITCEKCIAVLQAVANVIITHALGEKP